MIAISDEGGALREAFSFDAWGICRATDWRGEIALESFSPVIGWETHRGFTNHEHVDQVGLIHMNGRVYDPVIGRFLSADPFVQFPEQLHSFNRYTYVLINPLSYTDPTGYWIPQAIFVAVSAFIASNSDNDLIRVVAQIASCAVGDVYGCVGHSVVQAYVAVSYTHLTLPTIYSV